MIILPENWELLRLIFKIYVMLVWGYVKVRDDLRMGR